MVEGLDNNLVQHTAYKVAKNLDSDGIFEIRAKVSSNICRVLYFFYFGNQIILTNGFVKKTSKTPAKEIEKAKRYRKDYIQRKGEMQ